MQQTDKAYFSCSPGIAVQLIGASFKIACYDQAPVVRLNGCAQPKIPLEPLDNPSLWGPLAQLVERLTLNQ